MVPAARTVHWGRPGQQGLIRELMFAEKAWTSPYTPGSRERAQPRP